MADETTPQDGKAMPPASAGSHGPALWALEWKEDAGRIDPEWVYGTCEEATEVNETGCYGRATVVPLYRSPTLTDAERKAIEWAETAAIVEAANATDANEAEIYWKRYATLHALLERLS